MLLLWDLILSSIIIKMYKMKGHGINDSFLSQKRLSYSLFGFSLVDNADMVSRSEDLHTTGEIIIERFQEFMIKV